MKKVFSPGGPFGRPALYHDWCPQTKLVFTIHNVEYQGWADASFFDNILGLPDEYRASLTFDGAINMMKGAIELSDIVTTVSKSYAEELRYPYYAHRLDGVLRNAWLWGITNAMTCRSVPETASGRKRAASSSFPIYSAASAP